MKIEEYINKVVSAGELLRECLKHLQILGKDLVEEIP